MPCDPQAFAQFFSAFKTFYMQCRPGVRALRAPPPASQYYIPDTLPSNQERPSTSASGSGSAPPIITSVTRPLTRSQSSCSLMSKLGPSGGTAPPKGPSGNNPQQAIDVPSIFQESPPLPATTDGNSASSSNDDQQRHQDVPAVAAQSTVTGEEQGGKRKAKKKHTSKKSKKSKTSDSED
ncbi:Hypothetical predicted protein [Podarcis lilfordi]|uniref:Uncharacterized protein n=1 Tax=Podarcis lilfordi TaxID=74358 RepID=A0AA35P4I7_9SAUR|nr:Hypothetical predicted protein [Podarcis lilfordi]